MECLNQLPKVSVCVVTYNQEAYIRECLQSIIDQEVNFKFEVLVGDDCSKDGTRKIIEEFKSKYPDLIKPIFHEKNVGPSSNYLLVHEAAKGKYVAHIDGDDYALPGKLQSQADLLDSRPDISFSTHAVEIIGTNDAIGKDENLPVVGAIEDLLKLGSYFVNSSVMYRRENEKTYSKDLYIVDYFLHVERASQGKIFLDKRILGGYRVHQGGISKNLQLRKKLEQSYEDAFDRAIEVGVSREYVEAMRMKRRMAFAIARYLMGDVEGYKEKISIDREMYQFASTKHKILYWTRNFPWLIRFYMRIKGMG